ncbi:MULTISPECIES: hypothetical protein [Paenibacillus]|uniref:hypothetical protein n=1 Tax=Paenibacillus TaxID=44249 RepID=UPI002FE104AC
MKTVYYSFVTLLFAVLLLVSCGFRDNKTPEQWYRVTWSGLAGCDSLTFRGDAALFRGEDNKLTESFAYSGQLRDHRRLQISTVLPVPAEGAGKGRMPRAAESKAKAYQVNLLWKRGNWSLEAKGGDAVIQGLARLNPLDQLEEIRSAQKVMTSETGAARGTRVLRIELDPDEARTRLKAKLAGEMDAVKKGWEDRLTQVESGRRARLEAELNREWMNGRERLMTMLDQSEARAVFHLTIDRHNGLPVRLTSETELVYPNRLGLKEREILLTDNRFENYR